MIASKQIAENYVETGRKKAELPVSHMLILGFFAGMFIALAGAGASVASAAMTNASASRIASALVFPAGLALVVCTGAELFTGNCLMTISALQKRISVGVLLVLAFIMLKYTKFGRSIYAIGGNEQSALMMGLNVRRVKLKAYILDGFLCGVGSILFCLNTLGGFVEQAKGFEMDAIASSVIGGTLLTGGVGNVFGTLFGVLIKATIEAFITFQGTLSSWWTRITIAALLCFFIVLQSILAMVKKKK